ncbi:MAG: hypothetical protein HY282_04830 [Nitrospirae bacterium]|nr:hypothetical protein [Candidatus Manganitrophaceae bacterium]
MTYKIIFQYKPENDSTPHETSQDPELIFKNGEFIPVPNIGDSVSYSFDNTRKVFKVVNRHFSYRLDPNGGDFCLINIIVTDIPPDKISVWEKAS